MRLFERNAAPDLRVRFDANNLWASADDCIRYVAALPHGVYAIEEPLRAGALEGFERVGVECGAKIILDESLLRPEQLDTLADPERWTANVRVSKMGGVIRSLEVVEKATSRGIGVIVGAQVGETSLLTRAGLTVMHAARQNLVASEGAFGTHLLRRDLTTQSLMFGDGGAIDAEGPGLAARARPGTRSPRRGPRRPVGVAYRGRLRTESLSSAGWPRGSRMSSLSQAARAYAVHALGLDEHRQDELRVRTISGGETHQIFRVTVRGAPRPFVLQEGSGLNVAAIRVSLPGAVVTHRAFAIRGRPPRPERSRMIGSA